VRSLGGDDANGLSLVLGPEDYILEVSDPQAPNGQFWCLSVFAQFVINTGIQGPLWILGKNFSPNFEPLL